MTHRLFKLAAAAILAGTTPALAQAPEAVVTLENGGEIRIELFPADAPRHVDNFVKLARRGFYDGQRFHRVVPNFVAQSGDPKSRSLPLAAPDILTGVTAHTIAPDSNQPARVTAAVPTASDPDPNSGRTPHLAR